MATRTPWPGNVVFGEEATKALMDRLPGGVVGYASGTASNIGTTEVDICSITVTVAADRLYRISAQASITGGSTAVAGNLFIEEGSTDLGRVHRHPDGAPQSFVSGAVLVNDPSTGSHTYKLVGVCDTSGDFDIFGSAQIIVEDVGPAFS